MGSVSPFVNSAGKPYEGTNVLVEAPTFATAGSGDLKGVTLDPRLLDIAKTAASAFPLKVEAFSGVAGRDANTPNHPGGYAIDFRIYDDKGKPLANSPQDAQRLGQNLGDSFRTYEAFAQTMRDIQTRKYPDLNDTFRWGGYWNGGVQPFDLMHADITPSAKGAMGGGTWEGGLTPESRKMLGGKVESLGMNDVILKQLNDLGYSGPNAVQNYQRDHGLNVDGKIGPQTAGRVALDVTPKENIPNPYGLHDTMQAIQKGDPKAVEASLYDTMSQVLSAVKAGTPQDQIAASFNSYLDHYSPAEQANIRANFNASPDMQAAVGTEANKFGFLASGPLQDAVKAAFQRSQDLADSLIQNRLVGNTSQTDVDRAMANMAKVSPGATGDMPRLRPPMPGGTPLAPPAPVAGGPPAGAAPPRIQTAAAGGPNWGALLQALGGLIPGLPGLGASALGGLPAQGAPQGGGVPMPNRRPPMAAAPDGSGVMTGLAPRIRPDTNEAFSGGTGMWRPGQTVPPPNPTIRPGEQGAAPPAPPPSGAPAGAPPANAYVASAGDRALQTAFNSGRPQDAWNPNVLTQLARMANQIDAGAGQVGSRNAGNPSPATAGGGGPVLNPNQMRALDQGGGSTAGSEEENAPGASGGGTVQAYPPGSPQDAWLSANMREGARANTAYDQSVANQSLSPADRIAVQGPTQGTRTADTGLDATPRVYWTPPPAIDQNDYDPLANAAVYNQMLPREPAPRIAAAPSIVVPAAPRITSAQPQEDRGSQGQQDLPDYGSYSDGQGGTIFQPMSLGY